MSSTSQYLGQPSHNIEACIEGGAPPFIAKFRELHNVDVVLLPLLHTDLSLPGFVIIMRWRPQTETLWGHN